MPRRRTTGVWVLLACFAGAVAMDATAQETTRVSVDSAGTQGNGDSNASVISADGRFVAFYSLALNLVAGDTNGRGDVFVHDRQTATTTRVSVSSAGVQGNDLSLFPSISADGRYVSFHSASSTLVAGDTNNTFDVFVHDRQTATTTRVSVDSTGAEGNGISWASAISGNGRIVAFHSSATNLVAGDTNGEQDVFVHDLQTGVTTRVSVDSSGNQGNDSSIGSPEISLDGNRVVFANLASNLVPGDTNNTWDVFVHDVQAATTTRVSVDSAGLEGNGTSTFFPDISADGRYAVFGSGANNLVPGDTNFKEDIFVHDLQTGSTERVSVTSAGGEGDDHSTSPAISGDGRHVTFVTRATNLVPGDTNSKWDVFLHDRLTGQTRRVSVDSAGAQADDDSNILPEISDDGRFTTFASEATNLVPGDTGFREDVFVHGPALVLEADPEDPATGETLTMTCWGGQPSAPVTLWLVAWNGNPITLRVGPLAYFDGAGAWSLAGPVPPGLSGNVATFLALGATDPGVVGATNTENVSFQ